MRLAFFGNLAMQSSAQAMLGNRLHSFCKLKQEPAQAVSAYEKLYKNHFSMRVMEKIDLDGKLVLPAVYTCATDNKDRVFY
jgi:hypothetical protein